MIERDELDLMLLDRPPAEADDWAHSQYDRVQALVAEVRRLREYDEERGLRCVLMLFATQQRQNKELREALGDPPNERAWDDLSPAECQAIWVQTLFVLRSWGVDLPDLP